MTFKRGGIIMTERIIKKVDSLIEDLDYLNEKLQDDETEEYELNDLLKLLESFKRELWIYL